jgi:RNase adaptor protein for sRNA GlmZ degradation
MRDVDYKPVHDCQIVDVTYFCDDELPSDTIARLYDDGYTVEVCTEKLAILVRKRLIPETKEEYRAIKR